MTTLRAMRVLPALALASGLLAAGDGSLPEAKSARTPVLLELFTSEGCSSCPPADELLSKLDRNQPVKGADLIVLSEHVDYWNRLGWSDPFSSHAFSERQEEYAGHLGQDDIYTPQLVVNGEKQVVGSNWPAVQAAIGSALHEPGVPLTLSATNENGRMGVHLETASAIGPHAADLYLVLATDHARSHVSRGENAGRELTHVAVAYRFVKIATVPAATQLSRDIPIKAGPKTEPGSTRVIVFLQDPATRKVLSSAQVRE